MTTAITAAMEYCRDGARVLSVDRYEPYLYMVNDNSGRVVLLATREEFKGFGSRLTSDPELDAGVYSDFCQSIPDSRTIPMVGDLDLNSLKTALENLDAAGVMTSEVWGVDETSLPTFGGEDPPDTTGVWSWDETRLLVGPCFSELEIIPR